MESRQGASSVPIREQNLAKSLAMRSTAVDMTEQPPPKPQASETVTQKFHRLLEHHCFPNTMSPEDARWFEEQLASCDDCYDAYVRAIRRRNG